MVSGGVKDQMSCKYALTPKRDLVMDAFDSSKTDNPPFVICLRFRKNVSPYVRGAFSQVRKRLKICSNEAKIEKNEEKSTPGVGLRTPCITPNSFPVIYRRASFGGREGGFQHGFFFKQVGT